MIELDFEHVVKAHYTDVYRFALSMTRDESEACDLTQEAFHTWATRGHQLRDPNRLRSWLFTTVYREFLQQKRRAKKFPHFEVAAVERELPHVAPSTVDQMDADAIMRALMQIEEIFRAPLMLFYFDDLPYREIAGILGVPPGTVMSRIARGKQQLRRLLAEPAPTQPCAHD